jgi:hypothetical protein
MPTAPPPTTPRSTPHSRNSNPSPLSAYGKPYSPPPGTLNPAAPSVKQKVRDVIAAMDLQTYFNAMAKSMATNPPVLPQDAPIVAEMAKIGLIPGQPFSMDKLSSADQAALAGVAKIASARIAAQQKTGNKVVSGWLLTAGTGAYGTRYLWRAAVSEFGWGANLSKALISGTNILDCTGVEVGRDGPQTKFTI